ncbi:hypothetical protein ACFOY2_52930 [Nonomuraea purpurea]|uniref:Uncharacterized protein n=1 Tax=Nonomuraea purpurea TaxID=1849276 RepID=A0ABV8GSR4_9ACTN
MTRVFRKLGVRSRRDLSAKLLEIQAEEEALTCARHRLLLHVQLPH